MCWIGRWPDYTCRQHEYFSESGGDVKWVIRVALIICNLLLEFQKSSVFEALIITYTHLSWLYYSYVCNLQTQHDSWLFSVNVIIDIFAFSTWIAWEFMIFKHHCNLRNGGWDAVWLHIPEDSNFHSHILENPTVPLYKLSWNFVWEHVCSHCSSF